MSNVPQGIPNQRIHAHVVEEATAVLLVIDKKRTGGMSALDLQLESSHTRCVGARALQDGQGTPLDRFLP